MRILAQKIDEQVKKLQVLGNFRMIFCVVLYNNILYTSSMYVLCEKGTFKEIELSLLKFHLKSSASALN